MNKKFFEVFPTLKVNQEMKNLFEDVDVTKVTTNSDRVYLHVHLKSTHLLPKKFVNAMETAVKELKGVESCSVNFLTQKMEITASDDAMADILKEAEKIVKKIEPDVEFVVK